MSSRHRNARWAAAFHAQAQSDFATYRVLETVTVPRCHALHHLQMASEKVAKAYRLAGDPTLDPAELHKHAVVRGFFRAFLRRPEVLDRWDVAAYAVPHVRQRVETIAAEVEKLAPAADPQGQPRNAEYPWAVADTVVAPAHEAFADVGPQCRDLLQYLAVMRLALAEFDALA